MNLCTSCGSDFASVAAFDRHRTGKHQHTFAQGMQHDPPTDAGRRCLRHDEFEDAGLARDRHVHWHIPPTASQLAYFSEQNSRAVAPSEGVPR